MLARLESVLPRGPEWIYEPKLDGFRGLLWRSSTAAGLLSRDLKDLSASFPELVGAAQALPQDTIIDGEIVIANAEGNSDFGALQERLSAGRRGVDKAAYERPAVLLTFDVLRDAGVDLTGRTLRDRRADLEALIQGSQLYLQLTAQTDDVGEAEDWLSLLPGIEGVVAKRRDGPYLSGQREWVKVKRKRTVDCVVIGVAGDMARPWLVLGLRHTDQELHHCGLARPSKGGLLRRVHGPTGRRWTCGKPDSIPMATRRRANLASRPADWGLRGRLHGPRLGEMAQARSELRSMALRQIA
jgi:ATP-dependent DNA ligase